MSKISNSRKYTFDEPSLSDYLIGTDGDSANKRTRNYRIKDIINLFFEGSEIPGIDQNNKVVLKSLGVINAINSIVEIADAVNSLPEFEVTERENYVFTCSRKILNTQSPNSFAQLPAFRIVNYKYLFARGKGTYGVSINNPTTTLSESDFILLSTDEVSITSTTSQEPLLITLLNTEGRSNVSAVNLGGVWSIPADTDVYFQINNVSGSGVDIIYRFIGSPGVYGVGNSQSQASDFVTLEELGLIGKTTNIKVVSMAPRLLPLGKKKSDFINEMEAFSVTENELYIFNFRQQFFNQQTNQSQIVASSWFLKTGKGKYGEPTISDTAQRKVITDNDLAENYTKTVSAVLEDEPAVYYNLDQSSEADVITAINTSTTPIIITASKPNLIEKDSIVYKFVGDIGAYGAGNKQAVLGDLEISKAKELTLKEVIQELLTETNIFEGENYFEQKVTLDDILHLNPTTLPADPADGTIVNVNNEILHWNGTQWLVLGIAPVDILNIENTFTEKNIFEKQVTLQDTTILSPRAVPPIPVSGMFLNAGKMLKYFDGVDWFTLNMTKD